MVPFAFAIYVELIANMLFFKQVNFEKLSN